MSAGTLDHVSVRAQVVARSLWPSTWASNPRMLESSEALFALSLYADSDDAAWFRYLSDTLLHLFAVPFGHAQDRSAA